MKRIKLILTAIAAIGVVGGALAFKANKFGDTRYCFTTTTAAGASCIRTGVNLQFLELGTRNFKYVTVPVVGICPQQCTKTSKSIAL